MDRKFGLAFSGNTGLYTLMLPLVPPYNVTDYAE